MDNKEYIDYFLCDGAVILGHGHPAVEDAVRLALEEGVTLGGPLRAESQLADLLQKALGNRDDVTIHFTNSGTEAVLNAVMLSRIFTGREGVILIGGDSHGHASLLCDSRSPVPLSPECESRGNAGKDYVEKIPFNEVAVLQELVETRENDFGCILMEPIQSRRGLVLPDEGYLETVREISQEYEILLIFDEVYTGFRAAHGGAFRLFDVFPDFMCFGPIIAGGLPLGALCGKKLVLDLLFPTGPLFQAGNLSSRSISYQAGLRTLEILNDAGSYSTLEDRTAALASELKLAAKRSGVHARVSHLGSMIGFTFGDQNTSDSGVLLETHRVRYSRFFQGMLEKGVYLPPLYGQTFFLSLSHTKSDLEKTAQAALEVLKQLS